jgi:lipoprotein-anchoring transpeptidase ErfK/SrfK
MKGLNAGMLAVVMMTGWAAQAATSDNHITTQTATQTAAQTAPAAVQSPAATSSAAPASSSAGPATSTRLIVVSLEDRKLALVENGQVVKTYQVAVGKPSTPSPVGKFSIKRQVMNPTYRHDGRVVPPGPHNPVGDRWMGLSKAGYGIHGTNEPNSIGKAASHGCIRMGKADIEDLYSRVDVGDAVEIVGQRNDETARLFGAPQIAPASQPAMVLAKANNAAPVATPAATTPAPAIEAASTAMASTLFRTGRVVSSLLIAGVL